MAHWLLQANPSRWRAFDFFADDPDGSTLAGWRVTRYLEEMRSGDDIALWVSGSNAGVYALGQVTGSAHEALGPLDAYWTEPPEDERSRWSLPLRITEVFLDTPVSREDLRHDSRFDSAAIVRQPWAGNPFPLSDQEWGAILDLHGHQNANWPLMPGDRIRRSELHDRFGGSRQDGISPSRTTANVFVFSDSHSGRQHGYYDNWAPDDIFLYTGRGQRGDQTFTSGNRAILDHQADGRALRVFQGASGLVEYVGEFVLDEGEPYVWATAPSTANGPLRRVIRFRLRPVDRAPAQPQPPARRTLGRPYQRQDEQIEVAAPTTPALPDPDASSRGLRAHRWLQNRLSEFAEAAGNIPRQPDALGPTFDLAWETPHRLFIVEVKSCTRINEISQLRMGIGQVLDYTDTMLTRGYAVQAVLFIEHKPADTRWLELTARHGIKLIWPGKEQTLFDD